MEEGICRVTHRSDRPTGRRVDWWINGRAQMAHLLRKFFPLRAVAVILSNRPNETISPTHPFIDRAQDDDSC
ncbi:unnamed protein product [Onchocerca flexuosa]|uniref:Ig-like domain-containing protein n=1 Tax=Onchocerca flexuosa TaxID=387005 RepID=A0A183HLA4_9BILA|nr:unnamed protein product [Onchocerca flexuosa]